MVKLRGNYRATVNSVCKLNLVTEIYPRYVTTTRQTSGLFGDVTIPVALVGTSNSSIENINFAGFLEEALSLEVLNVAVMAGGPFTSLQDYLLDESYQTTPPQILVWEFPIWQEDRLTEADFSQVLASIQGTCVSNGSSGQLSTLVHKTKEMQIWTASVANVNGAEKTLVLESSSPELIAFDVIFHYRDGEAYTLSIDRSSRATYKQTFSMLIPKVKSPLDFVGLIPKQEVEAQVTARVCP